jgi:hypothetical protein
MSKRSGTLLKPLDAQRENSLVPWQAKMHKAIQSAVSENDLADVIKAITTKAKGGDLRAAQFLIDLIFPRVQLPPPSVINIASNVSAPPATGYPGTSQKIIELQKRAEAEQEIFQPHDRARSID